MNRIIRRPVLHALNVLTAILFLPQMAAACGCYPFTTVLNDFEEADIVVITRLLSLEKAKQGRYETDVDSATMVVEEGDYDSSQTR